MEVDEDLRTGSRNWRDSCAPYSSGGRRNGRRRIMEEGWILSDFRRNGGRTHWLRARRGGSAVEDRPKMSTT